jgi:hypothetical protein
MGSSPAELEGTMGKRLIRMLIVVSVCFLSSGVQAATFNVNSPAAFQTALTTAQANGQDDTISVAAGTYSVVTTLNYAAEENYDLAIVGAGATTTILEGGGARQCLTLSNAGNGGVLVSGLTCRNGRASNLGGGIAIDTANGPITLSNCRLIDNVSEHSAGGAYLGSVNGTITVNACVVDGNSLESANCDDAGGLDIYIGTGGTADITLENSTITNNTIGDCPSPVGTSDGAGVFMYHLGSGGTITVRNNTISDNTALGGPGGFYFRAPVDCTLVFEDNTISGNDSGSSETGTTGGGVHVQFNEATVTFSNNKVLNNRAIGPYANGGGLDLEMESGTCDIVNNAFAGNTAQQHGGGISLFVGSGVTRTVIAGNLFVSNQGSTEDGSGGGMMLNTDCSATMANNTFYNNSAANAGGMGYYAEGAGRSLTIANDIYRSNKPDSASNLGTGSMTATYANVQGGSGESWFGTGCIDSDPLFYNASNPPGADGVYATLDDGLHLTSSSPSMNSGSNAAVPDALTSDIAGETRIQSTTVDMGAYEGVAGTPTLDAPKLTLTIIGTTVSLSWTSVAGATGYTLYYAPYPKADPIGNIPMGDKTSMAASLPDGSAFYVALQAYNSVGSSGYSNIEHFVISSTFTTSDLQGP